MPLVKLGRGVEVLGVVSNNHSATGRSFSTSNVSCECFAMLKVAEVGTFTLIAAAAATQAANGQIARMVDGWECYATAL